MLSDSPMKVDSKGPLTPAAVAAKAQPFKQLLAEARSHLQDPTPAQPAVRAPQPLRVPPGLTARPVAKGCVVSTAHAATTQHLARARAHANVEAQRLTTTRHEANEGAKHAQDTRHEGGERQRANTAERILEIIAREFSPEAMPPGATAHGHARTEPTSPPTTPSTEPTNETKAAQATALIERIELFVRSQRPGLALTLNNSLGAHVEIERVGPREISLRLVGHRGPPSAEAVSRIREELRARGLKVTALEVA